MLVEKDLSELGDREKQNLLEEYLTDYAQTVAFAAKEVGSKGDNLSKKFSQQLVGREQDVLKLRTWAYAIVEQHIRLKQCEEMVRATPSQSPPESADQLLSQAKTALTKLVDLWSSLRRLHRFADAALGMVESLERIFKGEKLGDEKQVS